MSKSVQTVLISRRDGSDQAYHVDDDCYNLQTSIVSYPKRRLPAPTVPVVAAVTT